MATKATTTTRATMTTKAIIKEQPRATRWATTQVVEYIKKTGFGCQVAVVANLYRTTMKLRDKTIYILKEIIRRVLSGEELSFEAILYSVQGTQTPGKNRK